MGKKLENSKKRVAENKRKEAGLTAQHELLKAEFEPLSTLTQLKPDLDGEAIAAIDRVASVSDSEEKRISEEATRVDEEKQHIASDIKGEIKKLDSGLATLKEMDTLTFGKQAKEKAKHEYKNAIDSFESLLQELGEISKTSVEHGNMPENQQQVADILAALSEGLQDSFDQETIIAGSAARSLNAPATNTPDGEAKGRWEGDVFFFDDSYVPPEKYNEDQLSMGEIKNILRDKYGLSLDGIPYRNGVADFSSISVANIPTSDIAMAAAGMRQSQFDRLSQRDRIHLYQDVFSDKLDNKSKRGTNFHIADSIAAERQIPIPGLDVPYSATDLQKWRSDNHFTWDEQLSGGYNLVPSVIHGNLSHSGLVSTAGNAYSEVMRWDSLQHDHPELLALDEDNAPISIEEILRRTNS